MRRMMLRVAAALAATQPVMAKGKDVVFVTTAAVKDKPSVALDAKAAYILLRSDGAIPLHLMRVPSAEDQSAYDAMRSEALAKARTKYEKQLASYEKVKRAAEGMPKTDPRARVPEKPVEPTEANFDYMPFGLLAGVSIGPMNRFAKQDGGMSVYLQAVTPGSYRIYGPLSIASNGAIFGSCFCMGSVQFEARAGEIVDMGMVDTKTPVSNDDTQLVPLAFQLRPATATMNVDPRLQGMPVRPAAYRPAGKLPNYFGLAIGRIAEMPGVMRYDRDRIIDLTATGAVAGGQ